jgi:uncharacterized protein YceH (UPF0502 family)
MQDGSEALETHQMSERDGELEHRVEELNSAISDVRRQLEDLGSRT